MVRLITRQLAHLGWPSKQSCGFLMTASKNNDLSSPKQTIVITTAFFP